MPYWSHTPEDAIQDLKTSDKGLSDIEAKSRLDQYGPNEIKREKKVSPLKIFLRQFTNVLVLILIGAIAISYYTGSTVNALVIGAIVILNAVVGFIQEYRAEQSIEALKKMTALRATVVRDGKRKEIESSLLVPGDIVVLQEGDKIPADCRLLTCNSIEADESSLTGESVPVNKIIDVLPEKTGLADRKNMCFAGTSIVLGNGTAVVTETGLRTEVGKIAKEIQTESPPTPLQETLERFGRRIGIGVIAAVAVIFGINMIFGSKDIVSLFLTSVSLAVAAVPEGLPAIVTLTAAFGVHKMVKRNALIRRLSAVESLGSTTVICTDKTGTLTENKMTVERVWSNGKESEINQCKNDLLFLSGVLCNNADENTGDPTERALVVSAKKYGINYEGERSAYARIKEIPFQSSKKRMTTVHQLKGKYFVFMKGAPDVILNHCIGVYTTKNEKITAGRKKEILSAVDTMASEALRVLGFAYKVVDSIPKKEEDLEKDMIFLGLQGMIDPPRTEVPNAIRTCEAAGLRVIMLTGDHALTAKAIAQKVGLPTDKVITGDELSRMTDNELHDAVKTCNVFARINPEDKLRVVQTLKRQGEICAVTGDGVNDAPALKNAHIGVAMGVRGTDVAKEASDMILLDDNFSTIVDAVEEGRRIFDNIKKFINYLLSSNFGEVLIVLFASILFLPLPITAVQLLWLNLLTDGFPALALGLDPASPSVMKERKQRKFILDKPTVFQIVQTGLLIGFGCLAVFMYALGKYDLAIAQTMVFSTITFMEFVRLQLIEMQNGLNVWSSKTLVGALVFSSFLQFLVIYSPLNKYFGTAPLSFEHWIPVIVVIAVVAIIDFAVFKIVEKGNKG
jgi:P-type Ca2+ transporter type 2C